ncbi:hypothetical protein ES332_D06G205200v1 [Gossypium tomentosum]|uniref:Uncharacterized protein n=1 Tax=Gossypium tomentosum TaxID=34277 RepID=A0A5D2KKJ2_GOSTO|nr:hypothetical protein ES332_D06G205200v1 [Gossypium tomentosum]
MLVRCSWGGGNGSNLTSQPFGSTCQSGEKQPPPRWSAPNQLAIFGLISTIAGELRYTDAMKLQNQTSWRAAFT